MERYYKPNSPNAAYIFKEMNRYADEQQARWQRTLAGADDCAVCLEPLPVHPWLGDQGRVQMLCCGNYICKNCDDQRGKQAVPLNNCVHCRSPLAMRSASGEGSFFEDGETDLQKVMRWAKKGKGWANFDIGMRYDEGEPGLPMDKAKARHHYLLAAEQGHNKAMVHLALSYIHGEGCEKDLSAAKEWLEAASKLENAKAMCYLAYFLFSPEYGFEPDQPRAKELILRSAELGFPDAQAKCGYFYFKGENGFGVDLDKAVDYLTRASEQGDVDSMMALGMALMERAEREHGMLNLPGHSPMPLAINWMRRAGKLGDDEAKRRANLRWNAS